MDLSVGSLDDPVNVRPTAHFSVETRITDWHADDGLPAERLDTNERINARWRAAYGSDVAPGRDAVRSG
jgi:hypothetical protein